MGKKKPSVPGPVRLVIGLSGDASAEDCGSVVDALAAAGIRAAVISGVTALAVLPAPVEEVTPVD